MIGIDRVKTLVNDIKVASLIYVLKKGNIEVDSNNIKKFLEEENTLRETLRKIRTEYRKKWYQRLIRYFNFTK